MVGLLCGTQMIKYQSAGAGELALVAHRDLQLALRPIVAEPDCGEAHAGADHLEGAIRGCCHGAWRVGIDRVRRHEGYPAFRRTR